MGGRRQADHGVLTPRCPLACAKLLEPRLLRSFFICFIPSISAPSTFDFSAFQKDPLPSSQENFARLTKSKGQNYRRSNRHQSNFKNADLNSLRQFAFNLVNKDRDKHHSPPVQYDEGLSKVAQAYAEYLAQSGFFGHIDPFGRNPQDRATLYGVTKPVAENLAWGSSNYQRPEDLLSQAEKDMMAEPPNQMNHRFNIVNPRNRSVGVGVAINGDKVVLVQEFSTVEP